MENGNGLEILYRGKTLDDIGDLADSLLRARSTIFMAKRFAETRQGETEGYYELIQTFDTIKMLIEPALTFLCYDAIDHLSAFEGRKEGENEN